MRYHDLLAKADAVDRARAINIEDPAVRTCEGFADLVSSALPTYERAAAALLDVVAGPDHGLAAAPARKKTAAELGLPATTAVISTWNKADDVLANLAAIEAQTLPFDEIVVVDNASRDDTVRRITELHPRVRLIVMPHDRYGACETFNIGFASVRTPLTAILDDDVVLPPEWLEKTTRRMVREPESTAIVSTKVVEPGMPEEYRVAPEVNEERYMSTFRGCSSLARTHALREAGYYDERLFIYGNERDLTCRLLNLGYRVLQYPEVETFHRTPFGIKLGKRSLYYHARNAFLSMAKYAPMKDLVALPFLALWKVVLRSPREEASGKVAVAVGTIGIGRSIRETPGATWVLVKAAASVLWNLPYCLRRRQPVRAPDFELPLR
jgi:GT2 family glycosyltransferase